MESNEPIVIRLDIIREIVPKVNAPYVTLKVTEDCFDDIIIKSSEAEEIKNILLGNIPEKQGEQNPSTMSIDEAIEHCKEKSCGNNACALEHKQLEKWLTELKELKEQKPIEWNEEDEYMMNNLLQHLRVAYSDCEWLEKTVTWFKSLCSRKQWKPSEEQIMAIEYATDLLNTYHGQKRAKNGLVLLELVKQLKAL